jgi:tetratricopeptide (TPR) repeat protein
VSKASKAGHATPPPATRRLNPRALVVLAVALVLGAVGFVALGLVQARRGMASYLDTARRALDKGQVDMALTYVNNYLKGHPRSLDALELKGRILFDHARDAATAQEAIRVQTQILAEDKDRLDARKKLAELNLRVGNYASAEENSRIYLAGLAAGHRDDAEAHRLRAVTLQLAGDRNGQPEKLDAAIAEFEMAEKQKPGDILGGSQLAEILLRRNRDPERAVEVMDKVLEANPGAPLARLARSSFFAQHPALAEKSAEYPAAVAEKRTLPEHELAAALGAAPRDALTRMFAAEDALKRGDAAAARAHLAAIDPVPKDDLRLNVLKGQIELKEQRPDEAIQSWRASLIQSGGNDAKLHWWLARVLIGLGRPAEARQHMEQYRRLVGGPEPTPEYRYLDALIDLQAGRPKKALATLEATREKMGKDSPLTARDQLVALGDAYAANRDEVRALDTYDRAASAEGEGTEPWRAMARLHQAAGRPAEAIGALEKGLAATPGDAGLAVALAQALRLRELEKPRDRRDWAEFNVRLGQAERMAGDSPDVGLLRADALAEAGDLPGALARIEAVVRRSPRTVGPWIARIAALQRLGRNDEALRVVDEATARAGEAAAFRTARANLLMRRGEARAAYETLAGGLDRVPPEQRPQLWRALGEYHQGQRDYQAARRAYEEWARLQPDAADPRVVLLNLADQMKDVPAMEAQAEALARIVGPDSVLAKAARADVLLARPPGGDDGKARLDEIERLVREIKEAAPRLPAGPVLEAKLMARLGRVDGEIAAYRAALELRGGQAALRPLVELLVRQNRAAELEELHRKLPNFPPEVDQLAISLLLQRGDAAAAEQMVDQMVQGNPQALDVQLWKAKVLNKLGKPDEAEAYLKALTRQRPDGAGAWMQLLMFQASRGERDAARATLAQMRQRVRLERPELLWAACYRALGMRPEADAEFAAAVAKYGDDPGVLQVASDYLEATGRPEQAEPILRRLLEARPGFDWARRRLALDLSSRPRDPAAMSEAIALVGSPSPGESPDDRKLRAEVYSRSEDPRRRAEAIAILEAVAEEVPRAERSQIHEVLARSLVAASDHARAAGDAAKADADRAQALAHAAKAAAFEGARPARTPPPAGRQGPAGRVEEAAAQLARLEEADPKALPTAELKARVLHARKDDAAAEKVVFDAFAERKGGPEAAGAGAGLIRVLMALGLPEAAERLGAEVAASGPRGRIVFARLLAGRGQSARANDELNEAAKAGPADAAEAARVAAALADELGGDWVGRTEALLRLSLKAQPESIELLISRAFIEHLRGDYKGELATYEAALAKNPPSYMFLNNMAWTLSEEMGRPDEGLRRIDEAIKRSGRHAHLVDTRGVILLRLRRIDEAIKDLDEAAAILATGPIYFHLARAYKAAGREADFEKARDLARKAGLRPDQLQPSERDEAARLIGFTADAGKRAAGVAGP